MVKKEIIVQDFGGYIEAMVFDDFIIVDQRYEEKYRQGAANE